ncbi:hypothetical protein EC991_001154 [Linnemannia zychae]|nr:hypothetical protein EC991_001154 [Linnemannia zychae]
MHPVFHVSKLRRHVSRDRRQFLDDDDPSEEISEPLLLDDGSYYQSEYEVERIVKHKMLKNGQIRFRVKWRDYPHSANTWQSLSDLENAPEALDAYRDQLDDPSLF